MNIPAFSLPEWLQKQDAASIQRRMMEALPADIDCTEGGFPYDFTMPTALEKAELLQFHLVETLKLMHPMWAYGKWLDYHASAVGLTRKPANAAYGRLTVQGFSGVSIPQGFRFAAPAMGDRPATEFIATDDAEIGKDGSVEIGVIAAIAGLQGNVPAGTITLMCTPLQGVKAIQNPEKTTGGTLEESDEALRIRILETMESAESSFVGSDADYIRWAKEVSGIGEAFVLPEWDVETPGSVKLVLLDENGEPANEKLVQSVYQDIMSPEDRIMRKAPIGATLTVSAPVTKAISFAFAVKCMDGQKVDDLVARFSESVRKYYVAARTDGLVRYNQIHALLTVTQGVEDFNGLTLNGAQENIILARDEYPVTAGIEATLF